VLVAGAIERDERQPRGAGGVGWVAPGLGPDGLQVAVEAASRGAEGEGDAERFVATNVMLGLWHEDGPLHTRVALVGAGADEDPGGPRGEGSLAASVTFERLTAAVNLGAIAGQGHGPEFLAVLGGEYDIGCRLRVGASWRTANAVDAEDDWAGFVAWGLTPAIEIALAAGKHGDVSLRLIVTVPLRRGS
jgi:hypothetical protein